MEKPNQYQEHVLLENTTPKHRHVATDGSTMPHTTNLGPDVALERPMMLESRSAVVTDILKRPLLESLPSVVTQRHMIHEHTHAAMVKLFVSLIHRRNVAASVRHTTATEKSAAEAKFELVVVTNENVVEQKHMILCSKFAVMVNYTTEGSVPRHFAVALNPLLQCLRCVVVKELLTERK